MGLALLQLGPHWKIIAVCIICPVKIKPRYAHFRAIFWALTSANFSSLHTETANMPLQSHLCPDRSPNVSSGCRWLWSLRSRHEARKQQGPQLACSEGLIQPAFSLHGRLDLSSLSLTPRFAHWTILLLWCIYEVQGRSRRQVLVPSAPHHRGGMTCGSSS